MWIWGIHRAEGPIESRAGTSRLGKRFDEDPRAERLGLEGLMASKARERKDCHASCCSRRDSGTRAVLSLQWDSLLRAQTTGDKLHISALAVNMSNIGRVGADTVLMDINRWSTEAERTALMDTFLQKGPDKLLSALQKQPSVGFIRLPTLSDTTCGTRRGSAPEGGRRILVATDRRIGFWEARNQPRSIDYPFTLIEIRVGQGRQRRRQDLGGHQDHVRQRQADVVLENYASEPVRLQSVKVELKK